MSGLLVLDRIKVQSANAVAGFTWGFPALSSFLGFCDALNRKVVTGLEDGVHIFRGCAVVSHECQHLTDSHYGVSQFSLTRNPLTKKGGVAPFNEEGRMHMTVSLLIEVDDNVDGLLDKLFDDSAGESSAESLFEKNVLDNALGLRLSGGSILDIRRVHYQPDVDIEDTSSKSRKWLYQSLPGFALVNRSELLAQHLDSLRERTPDASLVEAWMDFGALRFRAVQEDDESARWDKVPLPETGWFVPLMVGYQGIAPLRDSGTILGARDPSVPFQLVESIYGIGQWLSPHRAPSIESLMWRARASTDGQYLFVNEYIPPAIVREEPA